MAITDSCTPNFARLKCDRQRPCGACSKRGLTLSCNYARTCSSTPETQRPVAPRQATSLHGRISELECIVMKLMKGQSPTSAPANSPGESWLSGPASLADPGTLRLHESGTSYVQSSHWEAILTTIRGLKEDLITDSKASPGSQLFYGPNRHATRDEILAAVPSRPIADRLMALHFDSHIITPCQYS
jgi:hypothetical protein